MFKIFIVEDDSRLVELLENFLQKYGFVTFAVKNFDAVTADFQAFDPHLSCCSCALLSFHQAAIFAQLKKIIDLKKSSKKSIGKSFQCFFAILYKHIQYQCSPESSEGQNSFKHSPCFKGFIHC